MHEYSMDGCIMYSMYNACAMHQGQWYYKKDSKDCMRSRVQSIPTGGGGRVPVRHMTSFLNEIMGILLGPANLGPGALFLSQ